MKVRICSRDEVETLLKNDFPENVAVISFYDPPYRGVVMNPVDYSSKTNRVFYVAVHDIDIDILSDYGLTFDTYFPEANSLAEFICSAEKDGLDIICQCEYGQSRSAGCAAAILEYFNNNGISIFANYKYYPNQLIFNKLFDALKGVKNNER